MASMIVSGAGTAAANGTYTETGTSGGKPYYNKSGTSSTQNAITWVSTQWRIYDSSGFLWYYQSDDAVATPDLATTWAVQGGSNPVPTVTAVSAGVFPPPRQGRYGAAGRASSY